MIKILIWLSIFWPGNEYLYLQNILLILILIFLFQPAMAGSISCITLHLSSKIRTKKHVERLTGLNVKTVCVSLNSALNCVLCDQLEYLMKVLSTCRWAYFNAKLHFVYLFCSLVVGVSVLYGVFFAFTLLVLGALIWH